MNSWSGVKPSGVVTSEWNVRTNSAAPTTSASDNATCATTSKLRRPKRRSPVTLRPCSLRASFGARPVTPAAGASPNSSAVARPTAAVKPRTRQSSERSRATVRAELADEQRAAPLARSPDRRGCPRRPGAECLDQELAGQPAARGAERQPHAQLAAAAAGARQHQVGEVGARDQQHAADDDQDHRERLGEAGAQCRAAAGGVGRA